MRQWLASQGFGSVMIAAWSELTANYSSDADTAAAMTMNRLMLDALLAGGRLAAPE